MMYRCLLIFLIFCTTAELLAQPAGRRLKLGLGLHGIGYMGDLSDPADVLPRIYPGGNLSIQIEGPKRLKGQLNAGFGKFAAQYDQFMTPSQSFIDPNSFVETSFFYGDLRLKYRFPISRRFHPFLTAGAGVLAFTPRNEAGRLLQGLPQTREPEETYSTVIPQIPFGLGTQAIINGSISMSLEYLFRITPTDYLDNVGQLGTRSGNDFLQGVQLTLYFTLNPPPPLPTNTTPNVEPKEPVTQIDSSQNILTDTADKEPNEPVDEQEKETAPAVEPTLQEIGWVELEEQAEQEGRFVYYKVKKKETLEEIAERFKVRPETLLRLNYLSSSTLSKGQPLRIPDTGAVKQ